MKTYDYIIAGSGCAGLSLLYAILKEPTLQDATILVIDKDHKNNNDRTWCYWEKEAGIFEEIVYAKWNTLEFLSTNFEKKLDLGTYTYKMIQGIDFYNFVISFAKKFSNITFLKETVLEITSTKNEASVKTEKNSYRAKTVFNSTPIFNPKITEENSLLQHFKGWVIKTEQPFFNTEVGRLMDFRLSQENGATFMYVLPTSSTEALVEYTLFSPKILPKEKYTAALKKYISDELQLENYTIAHKEFGIIPMSLAAFKNYPLENVINLGTSGGFTKASSGYTFQFIQKNVSEIVNQIKLGKKPHLKTSFRDKIYHWYDRTLIAVILSEKLSGKEIFTRMFQKISAQKILAFLGNQSTFLEDIYIMKSLPIKTFFIAAIRQLFYKNNG
ncbi:MAG: lycopene cyclase family protein [Polaribacter sp.]